MGLALVHFQKYWLLRDLLLLLHSPLLLVHNYIIDLQLLLLFYQSHFKLLLNNLGFYILLIIYQYKFCWQNTNKMVVDFLPCCFFTVQYYWQKIFWVLQMMVSLEHINYEWRVGATSKWREIFLLLISYLCCCFTYRSLVLDSECQ